MFHPQSLHSTVFANITRCTSPLGDPQSPKGALLGGRTPPAIKTSIFAIRPIANGFWIFGNPEAIQADCAPIGPELCPLRLHLDCDSRPQVGALTPDPCPGILCNPLDTSQSYRNPRIHKGWSCKLWPCEFGLWNKRNGTEGQLQSLIVSGLHPICNRGATRNICKDGGMLTLGMEQLERNRGGVR